MKANNKHIVEIVIWSNIGHCPITNRKGAYCDELVREKHTAETPAEALQLLKDLMAETKYAAKGNVSCLDDAFHNFKSQWA